MNTVAGLGGILLLLICTLAFIGFAFANWFGWVAGLMAAAAAAIVVAPFLWNLLSALGMRRGRPQDPEENIG